MLLRKKSINVDCTLLEFFGYLHDIVEILELKETFIYKFRIRKMRSRVGTNGSLPLLFHSKPERNID